VLLPAAEIGAACAIAWGVSTESAALAILSNPKPA